MGEDGPQLVDPETRAADPAVCPFIRSADPDGAVAIPSAGPSAAHRCLAAGRPEPIAEAFQGATCLVAAHVDCPRYLLGLDVPVTVERAGPDGRHGDVTDTARGEPAMPTVERTRRTFTPAVLAATGLLVLSAAVSFAFVAARGGLALPTPGPSGIAVASPSIAPSEAPEATSTPISTPVATVTPTVEPTPDVTPAPTRTPRPTDPPAPTPFPTDGIWRFFEPCPTDEDCVIYVVRTGNTLYSISRSFDVPLSVILEMNPQITDPAVVVVGDEIRLPTPD